MLAALVMAACAHTDLLELELGDARLLVEVADDDAERQRGLMFRKELGRDRGMLFVYPDERPLSFWMLDTHIPLSIAFLDSSGKLLDIHPLVPHDTTPVPSQAPAMYAIEVNRGWFSAHDVGPGLQVHGLPASPAGRPLR